MSVPSAESGAVPPAVRLLTTHAGTTYAAVAGPGLWASTDLGASWSRVPGLPDEVYAVRFASKGKHDGRRHGRRRVDQRRRRPDLGRLQRRPRKGPAGPRPGDQAGRPEGPAGRLRPVGAGEGPVADRAGLRFALYESKDAGKTWKHVTRGFPEVLESDSIADIRVPARRSRPRGHRAGLGRDVEHLHRRPLVGAPGPPDPRCPRPLRHALIAGDRDPSLLVSAPAPEGRSHEPSRRPRRPRARRAAPRLARAADLRPGRERPARPGGVRRGGATWRTRSARS